MSDRGAGYALSWCNDTLEIQTITFDNEDQGTEWWRGMIFLKASRWLMQESIRHGVTHEANELRAGWLVLATQFKTKHEDTAAAIDLTNWCKQMQADMIRGGASNVAGI